MRRLLTIVLALMLPLVTAAQDGPSARRVVRLPDPDGDAILVVPERCEREACPLLVVSHRFQGTPEHGINREGNPVYARFLERFQDAGFALLLSADAGPETWGNEAALASASRAWEAAGRLLDFGGETFTLGISMGGLPATLLGLHGRIPVLGTVLVAGVASLTSAASHNPTLAASVLRAYGSPDRQGLPEVHDPPLVVARADRPVPPVMAVASRADATVPFGPNSEAYVVAAARSEPRSRLLEVTGGHLSGAHFSDAVADAAIEFLSGLRAARLAGRP